MPPNTEEVRNGEAVDGLDPAPIGVRGLLLAQLAALSAGHLAGAIVITRRLPRGARTQVALGLSLAHSTAVKRSSADHPGGACACRLR